MHTSAQPHLEALPPSTMSSGQQSNTRKPFHSVGCNALQRQIHNEKRAETHLGNSVKPSIASSKFCKQRKLCHWCRSNQLQSNQCPLEDDPRPWTTEHWKPNHSNEQEWDGKNVQAPRFHTVPLLFIEVVGFPMHCSPRPRIIFKEAWVELVLALRHRWHSLLCLQNSLIAVDCYAELRMCVCACLTLAGRRCRALRPAGWERFWLLDGCPEDGFYWLDCLPGLISDTAARFWVEEATLFHL